MFSNIVPPLTPAPLACPIGGPGAVLPPVLGRAVASARGRCVARGGRPLRAGQQSARVAVGCAAAGAQTWRRTPRRLRSTLPVGREGGEGGGEGSGEGGESCWLLLARWQPLTPRHMTSRLSQYSHICIGVVVMTDVIHDRSCHYNGYLRKKESLDFSSIDL